MKKLLCLCAALAMAFTAAAAMAADVTGTWNGSAETPNGNFQLTFTFKQDGAALTGTVQVPQRRPHADHQRKSRWGTSSPSTSLSMA